ncbi:uncharacterized protein N7469_006398 [Penicillium citrinum]|uniref:DNA 3'-5' helicase n=1 Tax=Penicillium citrinum TaxID=5077 RepID=A0A9W9NYK9_PENCI|nr:uncharacterized protein N7469_006398 [Penicillium citrinum]KAJ5231810.1 hypothetical protein N7469_006398 [Penicillium citrinum]
MPDMNMQAAPEEKSRFFTLRPDPVMMAISLGSHPAHWLWCISGRAARRCGDPGPNIITRNMNLKLIQANKLQDTRFSHPQKPVLTTMDSKVKAPVTLRTFLSRSGIVLVPVSELCEQYRSLFSFPLFNAIQSKCFNAVYKTNDNLVLSAPTGSGKTVVMELAICRLLNVLKDERFKVIYQAPTKSLCAERFRDWNRKFSALKLQCAELTGDTDYTQLRSIQNSEIIITTPEKWDSITRKWKDHMRLMQLVKLFLIDEVHILKESRGATLEAVISRMKNIGSNVRFVALSATVPNSEDIATWLGKDATTQHVPAHREHFGEGFRPVKLQKFVYGYQCSGNDFAFDKVCGTKLPEVIAMHSCQKPMMIFCCTRNSSVATAKELARLWAITNPPARLWKGPTRKIEIYNEDLRGAVNAGVAFHHAGLGPADRHAVEKGFLDGHINVICSTSTLAVGVNLPCHLVIIKNTVCWQEGGCQQYSDLEMMQMLGRAGRPQFDDSATAVILTRKERVAHYDKLVSGSESLESCLHLNLIEHLNAEIGLGNVKNLEMAARWLAGTFLFVRLRRNPTYYKLKEGASEKDEDELLRQICEKDIKLLRESGLVEMDRLHPTHFGEAMARYYIRFETMRILLSLGPGAAVPEILNTISRAEEFHEIRFKAGEKPLYREINKDPGIRYPIKMDISQSDHKISLLIQSELGAIDFPTGDQFQKHKFTFQQEKMLVLSRVNRLIRCVIDCQISRQNSTATLNSLELVRSFGAKVWDNSPLQMKQIEQIGVVAVRKLAASGITSLIDLESTEPHQIEMTLSKNPPFGTKLLARMREFPKLRIAMKMTGKETTSESLKVRFKLEVAFMNEKVQTIFQRRPIYVCCLTETSDGRLIDFRRITAHKLQEGLEASLVAEINAPDQSIIGHAMCDDIAGTARYAELKPETSFLAHKKSKSLAHEKIQLPDISVVMSQKPQNKPKSGSKKDTFEGDDMDLDDLLAVGSSQKGSKQVDNQNIKSDDDIDWISIDSTSSPPRNGRGAPQKKDREWAADMGAQEEDYEPIRLANGNWACNHKCKDKTRCLFLLGVIRHCTNHNSCKHFCCRDGLEKLPRPGKSKATINLKAPGQSQLTLKASMKDKHTHKDDTITKSKQNIKRKTSQLSERGAGSSHPSLARKKIKQTQINYKNGGKGNVPKPQKEHLKSPSKIPSSDYGDDVLSDLPSPSTFLEPTASLSMQPASPNVYPAEPKDNTIDPVVLSTPGPDVRTDSGQVETTPQEMHPETTQIARDISLLNPPSQQEVIEICDSTMPELSPEIFTSPAAIKSSATSLPLSMSPADTPRSPKGKGRALDQIIDDLEQPRNPQYPLISSLHEILSVPSSTRLSLMDIEAEESSGSEGAEGGWEDIDRMLYEEYNNIVNFY